MKTCYLLVIVALAATGLPAMAEDKSSKQESGDRPCLSHFAKVGNFLARELNTWQEFSGSDFEIAFRKVAQATTKFGWSNVNANKDTGTITAGGGGGTISIVVSDAGKGAIRVDAKMILRGADNMTFTDAKAQKALCVSVEAPAN